MILRNREYNIESGSSRHRFAASLLQTCHKTENIRNVWMNKLSFRVLLKWMSSFPILNMISVTTHVNAGNFIDTSHWIFYLSVSPYFLLKMSSLLHQTDYTQHLSRTKCTLVLIFNDDKLHFSATLPELLLSEHLKSTL